MDEKKGYAIRVSSGDLRRYKRLAERRFVPLSYLVRCLLDEWQIAENNKDYPTERLYYRISERLREFDEHE